MSLLKNLADKIWGCNLAGSNGRISHGNGQMRAQSFSIQASNRIKCNAGCRFCIARTTPGANDSVSARDLKVCNFPRLRIGLNYARQLGASHSVITSRADPTQEDNNYLLNLVSISREYLPLVDMHTNGYLLLPGMPKEDLLERLTAAGLTMVTFSIASFDFEQNRHIMLQKKSGAEMVKLARDLGLMVRCSLVVNTEGVRSFEGVMNYILQAGELGAQSVVVREVWTPDVYGDYSHQVFDWNLEHKVPLKPIMDKFVKMAKDRRNSCGLQRKDDLPWGTPVFVVGGIFSDKQHGVQVTFAKCEEATIGSVLKSVVHKPDGHGYRNWDHNGEILY